MGKNRRVTGEPRHADAVRTSPHPTGCQAGESRRIKPDWLPPSAQEMVEVIGLDAALEVIKRWGGAPLYIPMRLAIDNHIVQAIGLDAARKLAWHYRADERRGGVILVPLATQALRRLRAERIMQALENESVTRVARRFGTTDRHIRRIKKAYGAVAADERQGELF